MARRTWHHSSCMDKFPTRCRIFLNGHARDFSNPDFEWSINWLLIHAGYQRIQTGYNFLTMSYFGIFLGCKLGPTFSYHLGKWSGCVRANCCTNFKYGLFSLPALCMNSNLLIKSVMQKVNIRQHYLNSPTYPNWTFVFLHFVDLSWMHIFL